MKKTDSEKKLNIKFYMTPIRFSSAGQKKPKYTRSTINLKYKPITPDNLVSLYSLKPLVESWSLSTSSYIHTIKKKKKLKGTISVVFFLQMGD